MTKSPLQVSVQFVVEIEDRPCEPSGPVGIGMGVRDRAVLSTGETIPAFHMDRRVLERKQCTLSRANKGAASRRKNVAALQKPCWAPLISTVDYEAFFSTTHCPPGFWRFPSFSGRQDSASGSISSSRFRTDLGPFIRLSRWTFCIGGTLLARNAPPVGVGKMSKDRSPGLFSVTQSRFAWRSA